MTTDNVSAQEQYEAVRERVAELIWKSQGGIDDWRYVIKGFKERCYSYADQLLSIPGLLIKHPDQSLPDIRYRWHEELDPKWTQEAVQSDMLNSNWVRVIKKGEVNEL